MIFKNLNEENVIWTSDLYYDLFEGGYIKPEDLLENKEEIDKVKQAILTINEFLDGAIDKELIVVE
jgi:hypothetical protein|nr:MAG TPA: hypothetical protein [Caudoviricetes sp.]